jgi:D-glycero-D-manno-heptose 1,7-bisphosphate phosphatase
MNLEDPGLWCEIGPGDYSGRPALFLDRDGVVVVDTNYLGRIEDLRMIDGAARAIARCNSAKIPVVLVTNQSGIARGYYDWNGFRTIQAELSSALSASGGHFDAVLACAYHGDGEAPLDVANHPWRKPNPGMILAAAQRMKLHLPSSWVIGDRSHDLAAGAAAGLAGGTLVGGNFAEGSLVAGLASAGFSVETAPSLADAVEYLLEHGDGGVAPGLMR